MNFLPEDIENIIINYKCQLEHTTKFKKTLDKINDIDYEIHEEEFIKGKWYSMIFLGDGRIFHYSAYRENYYATFYRG